MRRRQTVPRAWFIAADEQAIATVRRLPPGTGVLLIEPVAPKQMRKLRTIGAVRGLTIVSEVEGGTVRVHNLRELRAALLARKPMILLSPLHPTRTHPDWRAIPRMRASAMARLGGRRLFALGGMDARRFARITRLGFQGWAGISAFRT